MVAASTGLITTVAGYGFGGYSGDGGLATSAGLYQPFGVAVDSSGNLFIADNFNNRVRKVTASTGIITTVAGDGTAGYGGDNGPATSAQLNYPYAVAVDSSGNVYVADGANNVVRKVSASTGIITTVAGNGIAGYSGDGGLATSAQLRCPYDVALDSSGDLYIADYFTACIRKVTVSTGIITTVAGGGGGGDNVVATSASLSGPSGIALDSLGNLFIAESNGQHVRKVNASTGVIATIAGNGIAGYSGDSGLAKSAQLRYPYDLALDTFGNLYFSDSGNNRVRKVTGSGGGAGP